MWGKVIGKTIEFVWKPRCTEHPPLYSVTSPGVLSDILQCNEHRPVNCTDIILTFMVFLTFFMVFLMVFLWYFFNGIFNFYDTNFYSSQGDRFRHFGFSLLVAAVPRTLRLRNFVTINFYLFYLFCPNFRPITCTTVTSSRFCRDTL